MPNFSLSDEVFVRAAQQYPTPFHLYDEQGIRERARCLKAAFSKLILVALVFFVKDAVLPTNSLHFYTDEY